MQKEEFKNEILKPTQSLPEHYRILKSVLDYFLKVPEIKGAFVSGSTATGMMDDQSDLDLGFLVQDEKTREQIWNSRFNWNIAPYFHRFDADHIKPYFVIYFFEPSIHVDLNFYTPSDLPTSKGAPFKIAWDNSNVLFKWAEKVNAPQSVVINWQDCLHDDERFWAWVHYSMSHAQRGEYYDVATFIVDLRKIVEKWEAWLLGRESFSPRRAESAYSSEFLKKIAKSFCLPERDSIREAFLSLIEIQLEQRQKIYDKHKIKWKTSPDAIQKITKIVEGY